MPKGEKKLSPVHGFASKTGGEEVRSRIGLDNGQREKGGREVTDERRMEREREREDAACSLKRAEELFLTGTA